MNRRAHSFSAKRLAEMAEQETKVGRPIASHIECPIASHSGRPIASHSGWPIASAMGDTNSSGESRTQRTSEGPARLFRLPSAHGKPWAIRSSRVAIVGICVTLLGLTSCSKQAAGGNDAKTDGADDKVTTLGSVEVTAKLTEIIPHNDEVTFPANDLYDYVYVFKYEVQEVHRGEDVSETVYVGQYNPLKPRADAADARAEGIGGDLKAFKAGDVHRMALEVPIDEHYMGPIINKYFGKTKGPIYWAVWTNRVKG